MTFDVHALFEALDAQRQARGLTWRQVAREVNGAFADRPLAITPSTISGIRSKRVVEGDGVLQMLRWLRRTPESFVPDGNGIPDAVALVDAPGTILRFDTRALFAALDAQRTARGLTWVQLAKEVDGVTPPMLTGLVRGGRTFFPAVMRITRWLRRPAADFTRPLPR